MLLTIIPIIYGVFVAGSAVKRDCNHDNCLRAVIASAFPTRHGTADCSSYFLTTVTPAASTDTATVTVTISATSTTIIHANKIRANEPAIAARQATEVPSDIPAYASACSGSVRYSSACSCIGVTAATTTVTAPLTTTTVTTSTTTTVVVSAPFSAPSLDATQYANLGCINPFQNDVLRNGQCVLLLGNTVNFGTFSPGSCLEADCVVNFYEKGDCSGGVAKSVPANSIQCVDTEVPIFGYKLVCTGNGCV